MKQAIRGALVAAVMAAPLAAEAADIRAIRPVYKGPPPITVYNWTGCYIGGQIGGQWTRWRAGVTYPTTAPVVAAARDFEDDGSFLYGGQLGCNWQEPGSIFVVGLEGDIAGRSGNSFGGEVLRFAVPATDHFDARGRIGTQVALRLRLGLTFDRFVVYVAGGPSWADFSASTLVVRDGVGSFEASARDTRSGWNVGIGGEYAFGNNVTLGLEYRYTEYGTFNYNVPAGGFPFAFAGFTGNADQIRTQDIRLRFNYQFNAGPLAARF
jgi:outer membrane immunogenic protein